MRERGLEREYSLRARIAEIVVPSQELGRAPERERRAPRSYRQ